MNTRTIHWFLVPALFAGLGLLLPGRVTAQTFTTLHFCTGATDDAGNPQAGLILSGTTLYGTATAGGVGAGGLFVISTDGTGFRMFYDFSGAPISGSDGANPLGGLILSGTTLYGTANGGGSSANAGTVFAVNTNGTGFIVLHAFAGYPNDGGHPSDRLILSGNTLYGTTYRGGSLRAGTVFKVNTDGTDYTILHILASSSDGSNPRDGLILSGNTLYGTTTSGGTANNGTVFAMNTNGTGFTVVHNFTALSNSTNSDGVGPQADLILVGNTLYGTAIIGGSSSNGTVFAVNTNGTGFTNLHSFTAVGTNSSGVYTNGDGANPQAGLILWSNTLYGTASVGGSSGNGTVFAINTNGTGFTNLHSFTGGSGGADPYAGLILSGDTLYGTTAGSSTANGTVFSLSLGSVSVSAPQLAIILSKANVILTWPTNAAGFTLQSATELGSSAVWTTNSLGPVVVNGQNAVTNPISGTKQFFRLSR